MVFEAKQLFVFFLFQYDEHFNEIIFRCSISMFSLCRRSKYDTRHTKIKTILRLDDETKYFSRFRIRTILV